MADRTLRVCALYPDLLNVYADRGNLLLLRKRCEWRGMGFELTGAGLGDEVDPDAHDLFYLGGGQDRDQEVVAEDLVATKADGLRAAVDAGAAALCVCGGFQLAGHGYTGTDGHRMPGVGILDLDTVAGPTRLIGNLVIDAQIDGETVRVVGFENHAGRTRLGPGAQPLGRVVSGHGNNGDDGFEGGVRGRLIGTYLHGPLLPKNPRLADILIGWALEHRTGERPDLAPLDDSLEASAHAAAVAAAIRRR